MGSGEWADSLVEFVDAAKESGQPNAVVNLSMDLTQTDAEGNVTTRYELTPMEREAIEYARQNNVMIVAAAGNDGDVMSALGQASQEFDNIMTVGAAEQFDPETSAWKGADRTNYSSYGRGLDVVAYGGTTENPELSLTGDGLGTMAGSSVATAKVTGAVSQVWAANPELSYRQVVEIIRDTATDLGSTGWNTETGTGLLNMTAAVHLAKATKPKEYNPLAWVTPDTWLGEGTFSPFERAVNAGTSIETAINQDLEFSDTDSLDSDFPEKYYKFTVPESGYFEWRRGQGHKEIGIDDTEYPDIEIIHADGSTAWRNFYEKSGFVTSISTNTMPPTGGGFLDEGTYYMKVSGENRGVTDYMIETTFTPDVSPSVSGPVEFTKADSFRNPLAGKKSSQLSSSGTVFIDFSLPPDVMAEKWRNAYGVEVKDPGQLNLDFSHKGGEVSLSLAKEVGSSGVFKNIASRRYSNSDGQLNFDLNQGRYRILVKADLEDSPNKYNLNGEFTPEQVSESVIADPNPVAIPTPAVSSAPQPGTAKVPNTAGDHNRTIVSNGVTKHYYENGYLTTQPSGASFWYSYGTGASTSVTIGAEPVEPSPKGNVTIGAEPVDSNPKSNVNIGAELVESNPKSTAKPIVNVWDQTIGEEEFFTKTIDPNYPNESLVSMRNRFSWSHPDGDAIEAVAFYDFSPHNHSTGHFAIPAGFTPPSLNVSPPQYGGVSGGVASIDQLNQNQVYYSHNGNIGINDTVAVSVFDGSQWSTPKPFKIRVASDRKRADILSTTSESGTGRLKEPTNFRNHPWIDASTLIEGYVSTGTTFRFLEKVTTNNTASKYKTWYKVRLDDGRVGYIWEGGFDRTIENLEHNQQPPVIELDTNNNNENSNGSVGDEIPIDEINISKPVTRFDIAKEAAIKRVGQNQVGRSTGAPRYVTVGNSSGWVQEFKRDGYSLSSSRKLLMLEDGSDTAYWIKGGNLKEYEAVGGLNISNPLGFPRNDETQSSNKRKDPLLPSPVFWQAFSGTNGTPRIHRRGVFDSSNSVASWGPISDKYEELGAVNSPLGAPTKRQWLDADGFTVWAEFQKGRIAYNTETHHITGHLPNGVQAPWQNNLHALDVKGSSTDIHLQFVDDHDKAEDSIGDRPTWVITHGWNGESIADEKGNFTNLAKAIGGYKDGDQVIKLDWRGLADTGADLAKAARWIEPIGEAVADQLKSWDLQSNQINLVGHSLGAYVSFEIAKNLGGVNGLVALDPAITTTGAYSISSVNFSDYSKESVGLWTSVLGSYATSSTASTYISKLNANLETLPWYEQENPKERHSAAVTEYARMFE
ncbi:MAG: subtilase family serine protease [Phormidium sp. OSCR]|nr:MAG: subtilase family serine protease [Phormidium sp. OSCR]